MRPAAAQPPAGASPGAVSLFLCFAFAYFLSALLRAVTATLAPQFSQELGLGAGDLGLLAGAYFLGFAALQLPLGRGIDRFGPRRVLLALLLLAVAGCAAFASATHLWSLALARCCIGMGVAACLMAPLSSYRARFSASAQLRANSWMLMTGSLGMLASTVPVQWLLPLWGWRGLFWALALAMLAAWVLIAWRVPPDAPPPAAGPVPGSYGAIARHPLFVALAPLGFFGYGGMIAVQSLWAGPWLTQVSQWSAAQAAQGLFLINSCMLVAFAAWGGLMPRLVRRGLGAQRLITLGLPLSLALLFWVAWLGPAADARHWAAWCVASTVVALSQPAVGQAFEAAQSGRALSAFNLVIFSGVFALQWLLGLWIDALVGQGWQRPQAFRLAFAGLALACSASYLWFLMRQPPPDDPRR